MLDKNLDGLGLDATTKDKLLQLAGTAVAGAIGGNAAAGTAGMADAYNKQLHPEEKDKARQIVAKVAAQGIKNPDGSPITQDQVENASQ